MQAAVMRIEFAESWVNALIDGLLSFGIFSLLAISFWYPAKYLSLENTSIAVILVNHLAAAIVASGIWVILLYFILMDGLAATAAQETLFRSTVSWRLALGILLYSLVTFFFYLQSYYASFHERELRAVELKNLAREAELRSLKLQINPHFIFNSLNSLNALIGSNPKAASTMTVKLSQMLRATLTSNERSVRALSEELETANFYLDIERERFGDKIRYTEQIQPEALNWKVPSMCLQPLFENAIKHAVYESLTPISIRLNTEIRNDLLILTLENDLSEGVSSRSGTGVGLQNVRSRLELLYDRENLLQTRQTETDFIVKLIIPANEVK